MNQKSIRFRIAAVSVFVILSVSVGIAHRMLSRPPVPQFIADCQHAPVDRSQSCWNRLIKTEASTGSLQDILTVYAAIATTGDIECHTLGHTVGRMVQERFGSNPALLFRPPTGASLKSCGWGFWHGYIAAYAREEQDPLTLRNLCTSIPEPFHARYDCYHGIGLGLFGDPPPPSEWGNPGAAAGRVIPVCDRISAGGSDADACYTGFYHQMIDDMFNSQYGYTRPDIQNPLSVCTSRAAESQRPCFEQMAPRLYAYIGDAGFFGGNSIATLRSLPYGDEMVKIAISGAINSTGTDTRLDEFYAKCLAMNAGSRVCLQGIILGEFGKGDPAAKVKSLTGWCTKLSAPEEIRTFCAGEVRRVNDEN
jgi:hypothetical protein